jgi:DNA-binding transcriptional regulator YiaG
MGSGRLAEGDGQVTSAQFKAARNALCLSQRDLAEVWSMGKNGERTIRRWEQGDTPLNPIAAYCISLMLDASTDP